MTKTLKMIDTADGEILVERMFDASDDSHQWHMENSLMRIFSMQYRDATGASEETANSYVLDAVDAGKIAFA